MISSLNGTTPGGWVRYARHLADAGAHAIELNLYDVVVDPRQSGITSCSLAATTGAHIGADALKLMLAGADVVMTTSALLHHGPEQFAVMEAEMRAWMDERDDDSLEQLKGSVGRRKVPDLEVYQRANYYQVLHSWKPPSPTR